jgi:hypothetical protein
MKGEQMELLEKLPSIRAVISAVGAERHKGARKKPGALV